MQIVFGWKERCCGIKLYGALIGVSLIWGTSFMFMKILLPYANPWQIVFLQCLFGAIPLYVLILWRSTKIAWRKIPFGPLIIAGVNPAIPWTLTALSQTKIASSTASIIYATTPIWTSLIGFILFSVILLKRQWLGILIGFIGILIIFNFDVAGFFSGGFVGLGTMVLAPIIMSFSNQFVHRYLREVPSTIIAAGTLTIGFITTGILSITLDGFPTTVFTSATSIGAILILGVFGAGVSYLLNYYMITKGSAEFASLATYLVPISAMFWGWMILDESLSWNLWLGLLVIFAGVYLSEARSK